jgi:hypothetical protein
MAEKEYIERDKVMDALLNEQYGYLCEDAINAIPAADVVPVVLCRDCKCYRQSSFIDKHMECARSGFPVHSVDFCSYGEKREES